MGKYGMGQKIFDQVEETVNDRFDAIQELIDIDEDITKNIQLTLKVSAIEDILKANSVPQKYENFKSKVTTIKENLQQKIVIQDAEEINVWEQATEMERHKMFLDAIAEDDTLTEVREELENKAMEDIDKQNAYRKFLGMLIIISLTNPDLQDTYMMDILSPIKDNIETFRSYTFAMLANPHRELDDSSLFPAITNKHANSFTRTVLLSKLDDNKDLFHSWNTFYPYNHLSPQNMAFLAKQINDMYKYTDGISQSEFRKDKYIYRGKLYKNTAITGYLMGSSILIPAAIAAATAATPIGVGILAAGITLLAIGAVATVGYLIYKRLAHHQNKAYLKAKKKYMAKVIQLKIQGDQNDTTIQICQKFSKDLEKLSGTEEDLKAIMEDKLISEFGRSISSTVLSNILQNNALDADDLGDALGNSR